MVKTILITGANRGIGEQLAYCYAAPDVNLILIARQVEKLSQVAKHCQALGANTICKTIDIREADLLKEFILDIDNEMPIDLLIANAGVSTSLQPHWQPETEDDVRRTFEINLHGTLNTINPLISRMILRKKGQIAIISSIAGLRGFPHSPSYCASKAAIRIYGESIRSWLTRYDVQVSIICPGFVKTEMSDRLSGDKPFLISSEKAAQIIQRGLKKNKRYIIFPWQLYLVNQLAGLLPQRLLDVIMNSVENYVKK